MGTNNLKKTNRITSHANFPSDTLLATRDEVITSPITITISTILNDHNSLEFRDHRVRSLTPGTRKILFGECDNQSLAPHWTFLLCHSGVVVVIVIVVVSVLIEAMRSLSMRAALRMQPHAIITRYIRSYHLCVQDLDLLFLITCGWNVGKIMPPSWWPANQPARATYTLLVCETKRSPRRPSSTSATSNRRISKNRCECRPEI